MRTVSMRGGRLTLPADVRKELGVGDATEFEVEIDRAQDALILRPALVLRREDAWAYTPQHRRVLRRAHQDTRAGRVREMTEEQLAKLGR